MGTTMGTTTGMRQARPEAGVETAIAFALNYTVAGPSACDAAGLALALLRPEAADAPALAANDVTMLASLPAVRTAA